VTGEMIELALITIALVALVAWEMYGLRNVARMNDGD